MAQINSGNAIGNFITMVEVQISAVCIGAYAGTNINSTAAVGNVFIGYEAGSGNTEGAGNVAIGYEALKTNVDGDKNTQSDINH